jgi:hypothetical protein
VKAILSVCAGTTPHFGCHGPGDAALFAADQGHASSRYRGVDLAQFLIVAAMLAVCLSARVQAAQTGQSRKTNDSTRALEPKRPGEAKRTATAVKAAQTQKVSATGRSSASQPAACSPIVESPRVTCDRWPSNYDATDWIDDVWRLEGAVTGEQKTLALYKWVRLQQHWGEQCFDGTRGKSVCECDAIKKINIYPYGECSDFGVTSAALGHAGGLRSEEAHVPEHTELEVFYKDADNVERWHRLDPFWGVVVYDKTGSHIANWEEIKADANVALRPSKTVEPWGDKVTDRKRFAEKAACEPDRRVRPSRYTMDKPLYAGETYILSWERLEGLEFCNANPQARDKMSTWGEIRFRYANGDPEKLAYGHELLRPFIEKVDDQLQIHEAHGTLFFKPLLNERFADSLYQPGLNVAVGPNGRSLRPAKPGAPAEFVYLVQTPYVIANGAIAGDFRTGKGDTVRVSVARADWREVDYTLDQVVPAKPAWKVVWTSSGEGRQLLRLREADLGLRGEYKFLVKVEMTCVSNPPLVGMDDLGFVVRFQEGVMALPRLLPGKNVIRVTAGKINSDYNLHVTYIWDDATGHERESANTVDKVPFEFEIRAAGTRPADVRSRAVVLQAVYHDPEAAKP